MAFFPTYVPNPFQPHRPGVPILADGVIQSLQGLLDRREQLLPAVRGLTTQYTIAGNTASAFEFLFGTSPDRLKQALTNMLNLSQQANLPELLLTMVLGTDNMLFQPETSSLTRLFLGLTSGSGGVGAAEPLQPG